MTWRFDMIMSFQRKQELFEPRRDLFRVLGMFLAD